MVKLKCPRCGKEWEYGGANTHKATCPDCRGLVAIQNGLGNTEGVKAEDRRERGHLGSDTDSGGVVQ